MNSNVSRSGLEIAVEWIAAACLGGAAGLAVARLAPLGAGIAGAAAAGGVIAALALIMLARVDRRDAVGALFTPIEFVTGGSGDEEVLLLDQPLDGDDVLLLDEPLPAIDADSRVVRLFAAEPGSLDRLTLPAPGEMLSRIENFLGGSGSAGEAGSWAPAAVNAASADASAALHAALADIRRSLRHG